MAVSLTGSSRRQFRDGPGWIVPVRGPCSAPSAIARTLGAPILWRKERLQVAELAQNGTDPVGMRQLPKIAAGAADRLPPCQHVTVPRVDRRELSSAVTVEI
jgi:hypothetical protein